MNVKDILEILEEMEIKPVENTSRDEAVGLFLYYSDIEKLLWMIRSSDSIG